MSKKIALIGAGSAVFSLNLIRDICLTPNLQGTTVSLMDISQPRLDGAYRLCKRYAAEVGIRLDLEKTTDRAAALQGADFVINTALAAGYDRLVDGWKIGQKYGYRYGGSLHFMHDEAFWINFYQLRLFDSLVQDILKICPDAWYLKVGNPVYAGSTMLTRKYPGLKFVGLCHGFSGVYDIMRTLGLEREQTTFQVPGVNHYVWLNEFRYKGEDAFPLLDGWIAEHENDPSAYTGELIPKKIDLYHRLGAYPIGDTGGVGGGSWPWWHHVDAATEARYHEDPTTWWNEYIHGGYAHVADIQRITADETVKLTEYFPPHHSGEVMISMIESIACDIPRELIGNISNRGYLVPGVPENLAVEVPLHVSGRGILGIQTTPLPEGVISYLLRDYAAPVEIELEAYEKGSKKLLLELVMQDPWTHSSDQAEKVLDEILALPYHQEMREHYK